MADDETQPDPITTPMQALVADAMMNHLGEDARKKLITDAIATLLESKKKGYGEKIPSPLAEAFNNAVGLEARKIVVDKVHNDPEIRKQIENVFAKVLEKLLDSDAFADLTSHILQKAIDKVQYG